MLERKILSITQGQVASIETPQTVVDMKEKELADRWTMIQNMDYNHKNRHY